MISKKPEFSATNLDGHVTQKMLFSFSVLPGFDKMKLQVIFESSPWLTRALSMSRIKAHNQMTCAAQQIEKEVLRGIGSGSKTFHSLLYRVDKLGFLIKTSPMVWETLKAEAANLSLPQLEQVDTTKLNELAGLAVKWMDAIKSLRMSGNGIDLTDDDFEHLNYMLPIFNDVETKMVQLRSSQHSITLGKHEKIPKTTFSILFFSDEINHNDQQHHIRLLKK